MSIELSRTRGTKIAAPRRPRPRPRLGELGNDWRRPHQGRAARSRFETEPGTRFRASPSDTGAEKTTEGRVLIVDDETAIRLICRLNLQSAGFETIEAGDGKAALALARTERPDLILLDIMLPEVDGWSVAEELSRTPETGDIPILFLTARSDRSDESRGHEAGGVGYITKPFDPIAMAGRVRTVLERARRGEREAMRTEWDRALRQSGHA